MNDLDLAAITARAEAATPGPWFGCAGPKVYVYGATPGDEVAKCGRPADAEFVKHARTDERDDLQAKNARATDCVVCGSPLEHDHPAVTA